MRQLPQPMLKQATTERRKKTMTHSTAPLTIPGLETVYDTLATAIDQAGADKAQLFLVKLALLNANSLGDAAMFEQHTAAALRDL